VPITREDFGVTHEGVAVERYQLINSAGYFVNILTYGGIVQALHVPDRHENPGDVVLGFDSLQPYLAEHPYFGALIGRYANRIALGQFKLQGRQYQLATNNGPNHLHGGIRGFDKVVWQADIGKSENASQLLLRYVSADGEEGYPSKLSVEVSYSWRNDNALRIDYTATSDAPTILNLTNHSYFNLAGLPEPDKNLSNERLMPDILHHRIQLEADRYLPVSATLIPTGELAPVAGTCMDFRSLSAIHGLLDVTQPQIRNANLGYDHAWLLNQQNRELLEDLPLAATVIEPGSGRQMQVYTSQPAIQFYTGNFLDGSLNGKKNMPYQKYAGFCLETQHYPDAPNQPAFPTTVLMPGEIYRQSTIYRFGIC
jgi:aldose 1-epimerase